MTYTIHRYPAELIDVVRLHGGERIILRPILPQDADIMQAFIRTLSDGSRRNRFFRTLRELPAELLRRFTQVDYHQHLALVAEVFTEEGEVIVGEGRYAADGDGEAAEFAIAVADGWQGKGIGRLLVSRLERHAAAEGIRRLHGETLLDNRAMQRLARNAGFSAWHDPHVPGVLRFEKVVNPSPREPRTRSPEVGPIHAGPSGRVSPATPPERCGCRPPGHRPPGASRARGGSPRRRHGCEDRRSPCR